MKLRSQPLVRAIAFYLPQFHPIPENDAWWGRGFTEWTNVSRARPLFAGHYQPRLPADLGFYDLRLPQVLEAQADLARNYGIYGFCYHYYFFKDGKRLLEQPIEQMLSSGRPNFPFCLCWANENWTRRWDGLDHEILQEQEHSPANDRAFMASLLPYFRDQRYIRIDGRPLLFIYRATLFPDFAATVERWRSQLREAGEAEPYLAVVESYDLRAATIADARIDATCEFPPHGHFRRAVGEDSVRFCSPFSGVLYDYEEVARHFLERPAPNLRRFKTVTLGWDNTARKRSSAVVMVNFSLAAYNRWLSGTIDYTRRSAPPSEQFVFINAWNEWAEGTYLEPDQLFGHAYLEATRAALAGETYRARFEHRRNALQGEHLAIGAPEVDCTSALDPDADQLSANKAVAIAVAGDDRDLIEAFVRENLRLVERLTVAVQDNQESIRALLQALANEGLAVAIRTPEAWPGKSEMLNRLLRETLSDADVGWIVPLETTEFIDATGAACFRSALKALQGQHCRIARITYAPTPFDDPEQSHPLLRIRHRYVDGAGEGSSNRSDSRLIVNCELLRRYVDRYELDEQAQQLVFRRTSDGVRQPVAGAPGIALRWYPIRDRLSRAGGRDFEAAQELSLVGNALRQLLPDEDPRNMLAEHRLGTTLVVDPFPVTAALRY